MVEGGETAALSLAATAGSSALTEGECHRPGLSAGRPHFGLGSPSVSALTEGAATDSGLGLGVPAAPLALSVSALTEGDVGLGNGTDSGTPDVRLCGTAVLTQNPGIPSVSVLDVGQARRQGTTGGSDPK